MLAGKVYVETDYGFEEVAALAERMLDADEVGGAMFQTRQAMQTAQEVKSVGKKTVRDYLFRTEEGKGELKITCTEEQAFDTAIMGDSQPDWIQAKDLHPGQEVWATDPAQYIAAREVKGRVNGPSQSYYASLVTLELVEVGSPREEECFQITDCDAGEIIADGIIVKTS